MKLPRSILKPTVSALPEIPPLKKKKSPTETSRSNSTSSYDDSNASKIALRTEEEQQAAAREREERERRDARRKSLANRRVSFAAEATLHTFHEVDYNPDSTTSTDSSRRASAAAGKSHANNAVAPRRGSAAYEYDAAPESPEDVHEKKPRRSSGLPPVNFHARDDDTGTSIIYSSDSEPADAVEELATDEEEASSSDSDDGTMMSVVTEEVTGITVGSDHYDDSAEESSSLDEVLREAAHRAGTQNLGEEDDDDEEFGEDEEVIPSFGWIKKGNQQRGGAQAGASASPQKGEFGSGQIDDVTDMSITGAFGGIIKPNGEGSLEKHQDEDMSMDVTRSFGGILGQRGNQKTPQPSEEQDDGPMDEATMEFTTAIGGIRPAHHDDTIGFDDDGNEDMSMELTTVIGGVLGKQKRQSVGTSRRRTLTQRGHNDDATMDMTTSIGRIMIRSDDANDANDGNDDETMGMDITTAIGGIINNTNGAAPTRNLGKRIMVEEGDQPHSPKKAIEAAVSQGSPRRRPSPSKSTRATASSENEDPGLWAFQGNSLRRSAGPPSTVSREATPDSRTPSPAKPVNQEKGPRRSVGRPSTVARETTPDARTPSPAKPASQGKGSRRSVGRPSTVAREATPDARTPSPKKPTTPRSNSAPPKKDVAQSAQRPITRSASRSASKSASPQKAPSSKAKVTTPSPTKGTKRRSSVFNKEPENSVSTPPVLLTPQRKLSGVGADRSGLGSPRVAALFERRGSIGDAATDFVPSRRVVSFQDPKVMSEEVDRERQREEDKENNRAILEREADGSHDDKDATFNLREMIDSLSPTRNPLKGRKSLHVGSASGLLGKRPAELDSDEEDEEEQDGVKRLKGHQGSPVKNVRLRNPPSKSETTGHLMRSTPSLEHSGRASTPTLISPSKGGQHETPRHRLRFKDVDDEPTTREVNLQESSPVKDAAQLEREAEDGHIHLQHFLNMTSIRFMELTTTKRRHTAAPSMFKDGTLIDDEEDISLERCVVAGACTVPTLELYQHSCRELKKYISEGRRIVKEIETDTFEENPPLFREYMSAAPDVKALMDNQFKNVKTHARLLSKAMWYEWRMKLQDGLEAGLLRISEGLDADEQLLQ